MATRTNRVFVWVVFGLLAVGLVGWGSGGVTGRQDDLGSVDGREVPLQRYANGLTAALRQLQEQFGEAITFEQAQALGIDRAVLSQVVTEAVLDAETARLGLSVGDERVREAVVAAPAFQGIDGFDRELYREALRRQGLTEAAFEASLRDETARALLQAAVVTGLPEPEVAAGALAGFWGERRVVTWAPVAADGVAVPEPTPEELRAAYEADPEAWTAPERRALSYAWLDPNALSETIEVDEAALRDDYEARIDEFVRPERRLVERLVFPSQDAAEDARVRLDEGNVTFEALVEERGLTLGAIDLGDVTEAELGAGGPDAFGAAAGDVVGPVDTDLGPALLRVNAVLAAEEVSFEEARASLRAERAADAARRAVSEAVPGIEDLVAGGATVADIAERSDMEPGTLEWAAGSTEGIAAYASVREAAAAAEPGAAPVLVELEDGGLVALAVESVTPPALRPFEEVEAEVAEVWVAGARAEAALARAEDAAEAIEAGLTFESQGLTPTTEPPLTRRDPVEGTPPDLLERAFEMAPGEAAALLSEDGAVVFLLDSVAAPAADDPAALAERAAQAGQLSGAISNDLFAAFAARLQAGFDVAIDDAAVQAVHAQLR